MRIEGQVSFLPVDTVSDRIVVLTAFMQNRPSFVILLRAS